MKIISAEKMERGLSYGEGCFETFRVIEGEIFGFSAHIQRLAVGLSEFGIELSDNEFSLLHEAVLKQAHMVAEDALARLTVSGGMAEWGLTNRNASPSAYIQVVPWVGSRNVARLMLHKWPFPLKPKRAKFTADYAETLRALRGGGGTDVLFEQDGVLIAAATANLLLYRSGRWWTPPAERGVLPGVIRAHLLQSGLVHEADCPLDWLDDAEAVVLCNSGQFLLPVVEVIDGGHFDADHYAIGKLKGVLAGEPGVPKDLM